jgi:hypothetical protein
VGSADLAALRRRTARLIGALSPETLRRLVEMGGDVGQRRVFVLDASQGMAVESVIDIVRAAAEASGQTISHGLLRMLSKLGAHAEFGQTRARPLADAALREQVGTLLNGWGLRDPNPEGYTAVLQHVAVTPVAAAPGSQGRLHLAPLDPMRLVQIGLEVATTGPLVDRAFETLLADLRVTDLLDVLESAPAGAEKAAASLRARLVEAKGIDAVVGGSTVDFDALDRLEPHLTDASYARLLDLLASSERRHVRRRLLDRLAKAPVDLGPLIVARLGDERWFVTRNMLVLLERSGRVPAGLSLVPWTTHTDVRIRHEAIRLQFRLLGQREAAVQAALSDGHPRLVHRGLVEVQQDCPAGVVGQVAAVALDATATDENRELAVQTLGRCRDDRAIGPLVSLADGGRTLLGRQKLAPRSRLMLAAVSALATGWRSDPRAEGLVRLAAESADASIRQAAAAEHA